MYTLMRRSFLPWFSMLCACMFAACTEADPNTALVIVKPPNPDPDPQTDWVIPGIVERARFEQKTFSSHLGEIATWQDHVYVANSFDGLAAYLLGPDGQLDATMDKPADPIPRCTTLAIHAPSATLFCGSDRSDSLVAFGLEDPNVPVLRNLAAWPGPAMFVRDIFVREDTLWIARFNDGLFEAHIGSDGTLSEMTKTPIVGNVRFVDGNSQFVVAATSDRGLLLLDTQSPIPVEIASLALDGPLLDLAVRDTRAAVALGSQGAAVVKLDMAPSVVWQVHPPGVVIAVDMDGPWLAATTLGGTYVYEFGDSGPRLAGYAQTHAVGTDVVFVSGDLVVSDFFYLDRYFLRPGGQVTALDVPRGAYFPAGEPARVPLRNAGDLPLVATVRNEVGQLVAKQDVPPGETVSFELPWNTLSALLDPMFQDVRLRIETSYPATKNVADSSTQFNPNESFTQLLARPASADPAIVGRPAVGDIFPDVWVTVNNQVVVLPLKDTRTRVVFYSTDCIAMWPELEDVAWLWRKGLLNGGATPVFVSIENAASMGFPERFGLEEFMFGQQGPYGLPEVAMQNAKFGMDLYEGGFWLGRIVAGANHPTDYVVDSTGKVEAIEREYRGGFPWP